MNEAETHQREVFVLVRELGKVMRLLQRDSVYCNGVTFSQFSILDHVLQAEGSLELSELHGLLAVEPSTTTRLVEPLIGRELLKKAPSERSGGRSTRLLLTPEGRRVHAEYWNCLMGCLGPLARAVSAEERRNFITVIGDFTRALAGCCGGSCCL